MKFIDLKAILLLLTITLSIASTNSLETTRRRAHAKHLSHSQSRAQTRGIAEIMTFLTTNAGKSPISWFYVIMGIIGEFIPALGQAWESVKKIADSFMTCMDKIAEAKSNAKALTDVKGFESSYSTKDKKEAFCEKAKKDVHNFYIMAHDEHKDGSIAPTFTGWFKSKAKICKDINEYQVPKLKAKIAKDYGSFKEFLGQCVYFQEVDCDEFEPVSTGLTGFTDLVSKLVDSIGMAGQCIGEILNAKSGGAFDTVKGIIGKIFGSAKGILVYLLSNAFGAVANVLTMGIWGGVKAGYYIIDLGLGIKAVYDMIVAKKDWKAVMYYIGELFGKAVKIVKSILLGRRRRRIR